MINKSKMLEICSKKYTSSSEILKLFSKKNNKTSNQIPCIMEFYTLLESVLLSETSLFIDGNPVDHNFNEGVYFYQKKILVCVDIEPNTIQYVTFWTTGLLRENASFQACSGSFMFIFDLVENILMPHIYSYFIIDKSMTDIVPILSMDYLEEHRENLDFVTDGLMYLKNTFNFNIDFKKINENSVITSCN